MKNILVTGGCGFIGSNFIHFLIEESDYNIINYDKLTYSGNKNNLKSIAENPRYQFVQGDVNDFELLDETIKKYKIDTIVHFAAESHVDNSIKNPDIFVKTNVLGTLTLLNLAKKYDLRFHLISTDEVFGSLNVGDAKFMESTPYNPRCPYAASKASADHLVRAYFHTFGTKVTISNCCNNYGPFQYPEKLLPLFITNLIDNKKVGIYGTGENIRDWIFVKDHCKAIRLILENGKTGETYCIGADNEKSNIEITKKILKEMGFGEEMMVFIEDRLGHDFRYAIDSSKIKKSLGWKPEMDFDTGIKKTIEWYKNNEDWWRPLKTAK